mmetsp:Transcript_34623/g.66153  ORF Transcript_34623/g.66153 Transcript_34623/m.66153 type:complete len:672 (-) Transcript_34623:1073-3088(-)
MGKFTRTIAMTKRAISNMVLGSKTQSKSQQISDEEHDLHTDSVVAENVGSCEDDEWMDDARSETGSQSPHHMVAGSSTPFCEDVEVEDSVEGSSPDSAPQAKSTEEELQHQKQEKELFVADHRDEDSMTDEQQAVAEIQQALLQKHSLANGLAQDHKLIARFAATRDFNVQATVKLLEDYQTWRDKMHVETLRAEDVWGELQKRHVLRLPASKGGDPMFGPTARDRLGHPVIYKCMANFERHPKGTQKEVSLAHTFIFHRVCEELDSTFDDTGVDTFTVLMDLTSTSQRLDIGAVRQLACVLKIGFRARLHKLYIYPVGKLERFFVATIKGFLGKATRQKLVTIPEKRLDLLLDSMAPEILPVHLGGGSQVMSLRSASAMKLATQTASGSLAVPNDTHGTTSKSTSSPKLSSARLVDDASHHSRPATDVPAPSINGGRQTVPSAPESHQRSPFASPRNVSKAKESKQASWMPGNDSEFIAADSAQSAVHPSSSVHATSQADEKAAACIPRPKLDAGAPSDLEDEVTGVLVGSDSKARPRTDERNSQSSSAGAPEWDGLWPPPIGIKRRVFNGLTTIVILALGVDYGYLRGLRAGAAHQALVANVHSRRRRLTMAASHRPLPVPLPSLVPACAHACLGALVAGTFFNMPILGVSVGGAYLLGRGQSNADRNL